MATISQRQLRNDNAAVMRAVEGGQEYTVTRRGVPIARISAYRDDLDLPLIRPAKAPLDLTSLPRHPQVESTEEILGDLRGDR